MNSLASGINWRRDFSSVMSLNNMHVARRRDWSDGMPLVLLGPGGVGKSTLGRALSKRLGWELIDLDALFCEKIGNIGDVIADSSYDHYRAANLDLAERRFEEISAPAIFVTSSGFLSAPQDSEDFARASSLAQRGYGITLLPSLDIERATEIVVARQLKRGFGLVEEQEQRKFRQRFPIYLALGDALVVSTEEPESIAEAVITALGLL